MKKKTIALIVTCAMAMGMSVTAFAANTYSDSTYQAECEKAAEAGYVIDALGSDFTQGITREQFCKLVVNMVEKKTGTTLAAAETNPFTDTTDADILKAVAAGITNGTSDTTFEPTLTLTRQELATMLSRALDNLGVTATEADMSAYTDWAQVDSWAQAPVAKMSTLNVMKGTSATTLEPTATCTIEQGVLLVSRAAAAETPAAPAEDTTTPAEDATTPAEDTTTPAEDATTPAEDTAPAEDATTPAAETMEVAFTLKNKESLGSITSIKIVPTGTTEGENLLTKSVSGNADVSGTVTKADYVDIIIEFEQGTKTLSGVPASFDKVSVKNGGASIADEANGVDYVTAKDGSKCNSDNFKFVE
jgi:hypothetical protein